VSRCAVYVPPPLLVIVCSVRQPAKCHCGPRGDRDTVQELHVEGDGDQHRHRHRRRRRRRHRRVPGHRSREVEAPYLTGPGKDGERGRASGDGGRGVMQQLSHPPAGGNGHCDQLAGNSA
jgi:hypothetical protein